MSDESNLRNELIQIAAVAIAIITDIDQGSTERLEPPSMTWDLVLADVFTERRRQESKWGTRHLSHVEWSMILIEELGEWAAEVVQAARNDPMSYAREMLDAFAMLFKLVDMEQPARDWLEAHDWGDS